MKKIKDFFDKKQNELKFKNAGAGHKLSDSSRAPTASSSSSHAAPVAPSRRTGPDSNVASAALARFEGKTVNNNKPSTAKSTLHDIMTEEKKKISEEMKLKEELEERKKKQAAKLSEEQTNPFKQFEDSQFFTCATLDITSALTFNELMCKVKAKIFDNFNDDPILRSSMVLVNCNRSISQDTSRLNACLDILKKIVSNLKSANPDELEKFKRVRRSKIEQKVLSLDGALDFLFAIGFTIDDSDNDWLVYVEQDEDLVTKMQFVHELLISPQIIPIELDRQLKHITEEANMALVANDDLKLTSTDLKHFYSSLEKNREINEMLISKDTKAKLLSNSSNFKPNFAKLRFKFNITDNEIETVEAVFYATETMADVKTWFMANFSQLFGEKEVLFKLGPDLFAGDSMLQSLVNLKLAPAATLTVIAK